MSTFIIRPSNSEKEAFRVKLTAASLLGLRLKPGDLCLITKSAIDNDEVANSKANVQCEGGSGSDKQQYAIAWEASGTGMKDSIVQMSKLMQELYGLRLGEKVGVARCAEGLREADVVRIRLLRNIAEEEAWWDEDKRRFWEYYAKLTVRGMHECVAEGQVLAFRVGEERREFVAEEAGAGGMGIAKVVERTRFQITEHGSSKLETVEFTGIGIGGLKKEVAEMQKLVTRLLAPRIPKHFSAVHGVLIYGAKGVGKSHFIETLSRSGWSTVTRWSPGAKITIPMRPTLIAIDQLDMPLSQTASKSLLRELDRLFSQVKDSPCMIVGETRHPNDVDGYLRSDGKFAVEIEIPIPSAPQRNDILTTMRAGEDVPSNDVLQQMSEKTHGYVAADLNALLRRTLEIASEASPPALPNGTSTTNTQPPHPPFTVETSHLSLALTQIRPSALQEIFLETPSTTYADIGGHHALKHQLQNAVSRPLTHSSQMKKLGLKPKKGALLYGPPGCSKTLLVRALANEAKLNFLAVKGAELVSMYVGESERATREIFRKACAASPSIIFFDEIDAIATRNRSGGDLNVLTTLLNEMDGFEELKGVFVVAATNKPGQIDGALLRPGRFDSVIYIGPPDVEARREIFEKEFVKSSYRTASWSTSTEISEPQSPGTATNVEEEEAASLDFDVQTFAEQTAGFSGAEIVAITQTAAEYALDDDRDYYTREDVERAIAVTPKSISREILEGFEAWNAARMR